MRVIVLLANDATADEARRERAATGLRSDDARIRALRAARHRALKARLAPALDPRGTEVLRDYAGLPLLALRLRSPAALARLLARAEVKAVYEDLVHTPNLAQSLPLVAQPQAQVAGLAGAGTTVAVIDSAVAYANPAFGCTAPGVPAGCKIAVAVEFVADSPPADDNGHGTNVAAVVLGVAPGARVASLDVFNNGRAYASNIIAAVDWAIANRSLYNIVALNLSLGDGTSNATACDAASPFAAVLEEARDAGMLATVSSGNNGHIAGISGPACVSAAVSVGAVYDADIGAAVWSACSDASTEADQAACFSNSAPILTLLAPGAWISAAGLTYGGTSQAAPHVAGAIAVLRAAFPSESTAQTVARLTSTGVAVTDARNGLVKPRLALAAAARPANDDFAARLALAAGAGSTQASNLLASAEGAEPAHAGQAASASVWWTWTAPASGQARFDTVGSGIDTVLGVYTGSAPAVLATVAANDDGTGLGGASRAIFQATAGTAYQIAVDGKSAASGTVALNWNLDSAAIADLSVSLTAAPWPVSPGTELAYTVTIANAGPQSATDVLASLNLPGSVVLVSVPAGCASAGAMVSCSVAELYPLASLQFSITVMVGAAGPLVAQAAVTSATPESSALDNAASNTVYAQAGGETARQVPLPGWSLVLLGLLLYGAACRQSRQSRRA